MTRPRKPEPPASPRPDLRPEPRHTSREQAIADRATQLAEVAGLDLTPPRTRPR